MQQQRYTLMELRHRYPGLTSQQIADAAGISLTDEYLIEIGGLVSVDKVMKALKGLSLLTGELYEPADIEANLTPAVPQPSPQPVQPAVRLSSQVERGKQP